MSCCCAALCPARAQRCELVYAQTHAYQCSLDRMASNFPALLLLMHNKDATQVVVITGASDGIGREIALQYAKRKCRYEPLQPQYYIINIC